MENLKDFCRSYLYEGVEEHQSDLEVLEDYVSNNSPQVVANLLLELRLALAHSLSEDALDDLFVAMGASKAPAIDASVRKWIELFELQAEDRLKTTYGSVRNTRH